MNSIIKAVIAEDVKRYHTVIETFLEEVAPHVEIVGKATTLLEAKTLIDQLSPHLVFLDIQFDEEGKTAFDFLKELSEQNRIDFQIIIVTSFNQSEYYEEAFKYGALHYLTKPIDKEKLKQAIDRVSTGMNQLSGNQILSQFLQVHQKLHSSNVKKKISIEGYSSTEIIHLDNIVYFEAFGSYTNVYLINNPEKPICSSLSIGEYENRLGDHPDFFRIHRSLLINTNFILRFSRKDRTLVLPEPFSNLVASKDRIKEFILYLDGKEDA